MDQSETRKTTVAVTIGVVSLLMLLIAPTLITGSARVLSLPKGSTFGGQISQYMGIPSEQKNLAVEGKDFTLDRSIYFANNNWAVVHFSSLSDRVPEPGYAIFQQKDGAYTTVIGPSTAFMSTYLEGMPNDLIVYLRNQGTVYEPDL